MASSIPSPTPAPAKDTEEWIDRFATLFSPPTPRASPTNTPPPLPRFDSPRSPDTEFGAFVSVPPSQDPLATTPFSPVETEPSTSHTFFKAAKRAQERNKREVLDELLSNEDDPLFRDKEPSPPLLDLDLDDDFSLPKHRAPPRRC